MLMHIQRRVYDRRGVALHIARFIKIFFEVIADIAIMDLISHASLAFRSRNTRARGQTQDAIDR